MNDDDPWEVTHGIRAVPVANLQRQWVEFTWCGHVAELTPADAQKLAHHLRVCAVEAETRAPSGR